MPENSLLVLSDIHYGVLAQRPALGREAPVTPEQTKEICDSLIAGLDKIGSKPSFLVIPGDLTSRGSPLEFRDAFKIIDSLREALAIDRANTVITYGNHDVDWKVCDIVKPTADKEKDPNKAAYEEAHQDAYCELASLIGGTFAPTAPPKHGGPETGTGVFHYDSLNIILLNSGLRCFAEQKYRHGQLAERQYNWLATEVEQKLQPNCSTIVVLHHHLVNMPYPSPIPDISLLQEGADVIDTLGKIGIDLVVHGHRHHPTIQTKAENGWKQPMTFFCAGSFGVEAGHRAGGRIPNTAHVIELDGTSSQGNASGRIRTLEQHANGCWIPLFSRDSEIPIDHNQWFGEPISQVEADAIIGELIASSIAAQTSQELVRLPPYDDLVLKLRCMQQRSLNDRFRKIALQHGMEITGKYPDEKCILTKLPNGQ